MSPNLSSLQTKKNTWCLGYWITRQGIQPIRNMIEMIDTLKIKAPKTKKEETTTPVHWYSQLLSQHVASQN
jgi:hypothetical protein